ncbi:MAG TPA: hypothetical protein VGF28_21290 [Thermoanaerobaculia bacterium]
MRKKLLRNLVREPGSAADQQRVSGTEPNGGTGQRTHAACDRATTERRSNVARIPACGVRADRFTGAADDGADAHSRCQPRARWRERLPR